MRQPQNDTSLALLGIGEIEIEKPILNRLPFGVWISNSKDIIIYANDIAASISRIPSNSLEGRIVSTLFSAIGADVFLQHYSEAKQSRHSLFIDNIYVETNDGIPKYRSGWLVPYSSNNDNHVMIIVIEETAASRPASACADALQQNEERFKAVSELTSDYCYSVVVEEGGKFRNEWSFGAFESITGFKRNEVWELGGVASLFHPEDLEAAQTKIKRILNGETVTARARIISKSGDVKWMEDTATPHWNEGHTRVVRILGCAREITEQVATEQRLLEAQKMESIGLLAGGIAHDFNNILGGIVGCAELAKLWVEPESNVDRYMADILKATERAEQLIRQILTFSKYHACSQKPVDLTAIVGEAARLLRASLPRTIEMELNISPTPLIIEADPGKIHEIIMNLGINAAHAVNENGVLKIACVPTAVITPLEVRTGIVEPGSYVMLSVADNGCGMDDHVQQRAFDPFFTTKRQGQGTGMGLSVVFGIVKGHGGHLALKSAMGDGSTIDIYFPISQQRAIEHPPIFNNAVGRGERILFVDDEQMLCDIQGAILKKLGYHVTLFTDAQAASDAFTSRPGEYDLVITDQSMPHMSGLTLSETILKCNPNIPILLCTGYSNTVDEASALSRGIKGFLMKPVRKETLALKVRSLLDERIQTLTMKPIGADATRAD
jgi:PAS domain S-box-containing protein